jgi:hypothetical protein
MPTRKPTETPQAAIDRIKAAAIDTPRRAPVFVWMLANYLELATALKTSADWAEVASILMEIGIRNRNGGELTPAVVRKAWWAVRRHVADRSAPSRSSSGLRTPIGPARGMRPHVQHRKRRVTEEHQQATA